MKSFKSDAQIEIRVLDVAELNDVAGGCYGTPGSTTCPYRRHPKLINIFLGGMRLMAAK